MCSDRTILSNSFLKNSPLEEKVPDFGIDATKYPEIADQLADREYLLTFDELGQKKVTAIKKYKESKDSLTYSGYGLAFLIFKIEPSLLNLGFVVSIVCCIVSMVAVLMGKYKLGVITNLSNAGLVMLIVVLLWLDDFFEEIDQIKYGYYLYVFNLLLVAKLCYDQMEVGKVSRAKSDF